jgi:hypothetical protein
MFPSDGSFRRQQLEVMGAQAQFATENFMIVLA